MRPLEPAPPSGPVRSDSTSTENEDIGTLLSEMLDALSDAKADAVVVLGPSVTSDEGEREVLAYHSRTRSSEVAYASGVLAGSDDFLSWDGPLVGWQQLTATNAQSTWRQVLAEAGLDSFVRVAMELSGNRFFEIYTFTEAPIPSRAEAASLAWATMGNWPRIRRALASQRLKLSPRELECLWYVCGGYTSKAIGDKMNVTERTATFFITSLATKFGTSGRSALPQRASWLGLFDAPSN